MGILLHQHEPRRPSALRPAPRRRRPPPPSPTRPRQPPRGHPARLHTPPHALQRTHRLGPPHASRRLTNYEPGMSNPTWLILVFKLAADFGDRLAEVVG